ncbi:MAG: hypothetical protein JXR76_26785 [Deltaproteobacteria bacterium]|nr:hypothetical protein [Deltaproteobacteria bacterium]
MKATQKLMRHIIFFCLSSFLLLACSSDLIQSKPTPAFQSRIQGWQDDSSTVSSRGLQSLLEENVVAQLPPLNSKETPVLFVRGSLRADEKGSVLVLEGRFLHFDVQSNSHVPVKVIVMGSIEGTGRGKKERLLKGVLGDMKNGLASNIRICNGNPKQWIAALDSPEPDEQILALTLLKLHQEKSAVGKVIDMLDDPRSEVGTAAAETAAVIASQKHADMVIGQAHKGGVEVEARCILVLSRIGGANAIAWLEMLAVGHQNSQLRELSFNALKRLK